MCIETSRRNNNRMWTDSKTGISEKTDTGGLVKAEL